MAHDNEVLWIAIFGVRHYVFRTRSAARDFATDKGWPVGQFSIQRATWGPEQ